jgi:catecholate siderophore receptor
LPTKLTSTILLGYARMDAAAFANLIKKTCLQVNLANLTYKEYALYTHTNNNITPESQFPAAVLSMIFII